SGKDELQNILQQMQTQIALTAGQDKATNTIKQIKSVIELNPNGHLSESLLFLAKQQAAGNIEDVNKVTTEVAIYAANGTDNIVVVLEQAVAAIQQQQPPQSTTTTTAASGTSPTSISKSPLPPLQTPILASSQSLSSASPAFSSDNSNDNISSSWSSPSPQTTSTLTTASQLSSPAVSPPNNVAQQQQPQQQIQQSQVLEQLPQRQQSVQSQTVTSSSSSSLPEPQTQTQAQPTPQAQTSSSSSSSPLPSLYSNNISNDNNTTNTNTVVSNSSPHSTIKVTSVDQPTLSSPLQSLSLSSPSSSSENDIPQIANSAGNYHPIANLVVGADSSVTLNGGSSHDPDGGPIAFRWEQISGPPVALNGASTSQATFTTPDVYSDTTMFFKLTVTDQNGLSDSKTVQITVTPISSMD
ncbi:MAG: PKD domain-containing protein, partial [Nitrososphaeraceae archaeon]